MAFIEHLDDGIGKVLSAIKTTGIEQETIVIFSSDNGGAVAYEQSNGPLRGGKQDHWEGGIRVPTCFVWPDKIPAKRSNAIGATMDVLPTLCEIAGVKIDQPIDGISLTDPLLRDGDGDPNRILVWVRREGNQRYQGRAYYAIRQGPWKLLQNSPFEPMQLFNLATDPFENNPQPAVGIVADELRSKLMLHIQQSGRIPWQR